MTSLLDLLVKEKRIIDEIDKLEQFISISYDQLDRIKKFQSECTAAYDDMRHMKSKIQDLENDQKELKVKLKLCQNEIHDYFMDLFNEAPRKQQKKRRSLKDLLFNNYE